MKPLRLLFLFYKNYAFFSISVSIAAATITFHWGAETIKPVIWFRLISLGGIAYMVHKAKRDEFYYYRNLGFSKLHLWLVTLPFDFFLFIIFVIISLKIR